jgi:hypothetical protein
LPSFSHSSEVAVFRAVVAASLAGAPIHVFLLSSSAELQLTLSLDSPVLATALS